MTSAQVRAAALGVGAVVGLGCAHGGAGGVTIVRQEGSRPPETIYVDRGRMRIESGPQDHRETTIFDMRTRRVLLLDERSRRYVELDGKALENLRLGRQQASAHEAAELKAQLKGVPADQRDALLADMGLGGANGRPELNFEPTGEARTVNGLECQMYRVFKRSKIWEEDCISPWSAGLFRQEDFAALATFLDSWAPYPDDTGENVLRILDLYPGFPILRWRQPELAELFAPRPAPEEVKSASRVAIPASMFDVPAGFKREPNR